MISNWQIVGVGVILVVGVFMLANEANTTNTGPDDHPANARGHGEVLSQDDMDAMRSTA